MSELQTNTTISHQALAADPVRVDRFLTGIPVAPHHAILLRRLESEEFIRDVRRRTSRHRLPVRPAPPVE